MASHPPAPVPAHFQAEPALPSPVVDIASGSLGGMASVVAGQPLDLIKTRMQVRTGSMGIMQTIAQIFAHEGGGGFFKGMSPPLFAETLYNCIYFGSYSVASRFMQKETDGPLPISQIALAGSFSGVVGSLAVSPVDLIKVRLQNDSNTGSERLRPRQVLNAALAENGIRGLYRGYSTVVIRDSTGMGVFFASYEMLKRALQKDGEVSLPNMLLAGGTAGVLSMVCNYPIDVIKTRMQVSNDMDTIRKTASHIFKTEGTRGFYKGLLPCMIGAFPSNAALFTVYELTSEVLLKKFPSLRDQNEL